MSEKVFIKKKTLDDIGNAVRGKTLKTDKILVSNIATEIKGIEQTFTGEGVPTEVTYAISRELRKHKEINFDVEPTHQPQFIADLDVVVNYCNSTNNTTLPPFTEVDDNKLYRTSSVSMCIFTEQLTQTLERVLEIFGLTGYKIAYHEVDELPQFGEPYAMAYAEPEGEPTILHIFILKSTGVGYLYEYTSGWYTVGQVMGLRTGNTLADCGYFDLTTLAGYGIYTLKEGEKIGVPYRYDREMYQLHGHNWLKVGTKEQFITSSANGKVVE